MNIVRDKCILRPLRPGDKASITENVSNFNVYSGLRDIIPYPYEEKDAEWFIEANMNIHPPVNLAIEVDGKAVGVIGLILQEDIYRINAELGYWLGEPYWGRGIMTEAVGAMKEYAFEKFTILRVYAKVFEGNIGSMKVLEKSGFEKEAVLRKWVIKNGKVLDEHIYSLTRKRNPEKPLSEIPH